MKYDFKQFLIEFTVMQPDEKLVIMTTENTYIIPYAEDAEMMKMLRSITPDLEQEGIVEFKRMNIHDRYTIIKDSIYIESEISFHA